MPLEEQFQCELKVQVMDVQGPLPGALVHLFQKDHEPRIVPADVDGLAKFEDLNTFTTYFAGATFPYYQRTGKETSCPGPGGEPLLLILREPPATWPQPPEPGKETPPQEAGRS